MFNDLSFARAAIGRAAMVLACCALTGAAPASSPDAVVRALAAQDMALLRVGERLRRAALPFCPLRGYSGGLLVQSLSQYGRRYRDAARRVLALGELPGVVQVVSGGPADRAGIRPGDAIVSVNAIPAMRANLAGNAAMTDSDRAQELLENGLRDGQAAISIARGARAFTTAIKGDAACAVRFEVRAGGSANASTDSTRIIIASDLIDPSSSDDDLASVAAHELAHVVLRHPAALRDAYRGLLPGFGRGGAALRASEIAADRLSVYLLALGGYDESAAIDFWTRFGRRTDQGIFSDRTHPGWRDRVAAIREEVDRVVAQRAAGEAIRPTEALLVTPSG